MMLKTVLFTQKFLDLSEKLAYIHKAKNVRIHHIDTVILKAFLPFVYKFEECLLECCGLYMDV